MPTSSKEAKSIVWPSSCRFGPLRVVGNLALAGGQRAVGTGAAGSLEHCRLEHFGQTMALQQLHTWRPTGSKTAGITHVGQSLKSKNV